MIVQFRFETEILEQALRKSDASRLEIEGLDATQDVPLRTVFRCRENGDSIQPALSADPSVADADRIAETERGSVYQAVHRHTDIAVYHEAVRNGGVFVTGTSRRDEWELRMRFPDRDKFVQFRDACMQNGTDISVEALYENRSATRAERYDISEPQEEIIHLAATHGYFEVPREASLAELADQLDVSSQAASERLRRGLGTLVEETGFTPE